VTSGVIAPGSHAVRWRRNVPPLPRPWRRRDARRLFGPDANRSGFFDLGQSSNRSSEPVLSCPTSRPVD
jgi:hypothetical protein